MLFPERCKLQAGFKFVMPALDMNQFRDIRIACSIKHCTKTLKEVTVKYLREL